MKRSVRTTPTTSGIACASLISALLAISTILATSGCERVADDASPTPDPATIRLTLLQLNDVYEMTPLGGQGGLARVVTLKKRLLVENPNTIWT